MIETLVERLRRKLAEAFAEPWGDLVLRSELDIETRIDAAADGVVGGVSFFLVARDGQELRVHHAVMTGLGSAEAIDGWLAEVLSTLLAEHTRWPRRAAKGR